MGLAHGTQVIAANAMHTALPSVHRLVTRIRHTSLYRGAVIARDLDDEERRHSHGGNKRTGAAHVDEDAAAAAEEDDTAPEATARDGEGDAAAAASPDRLLQRPSLDALAGSCPMAIFPSVGYFKTPADAGRA